jgi:2-dehydropantoate 2-reductase
LKIGIISGGAVGLSTACYLSKNRDNDITLICNTKEQADLINSKGINISSIYFETETINHIFATNSYSILNEKEFDVIFVMVKQHHLDNVGKTLQQINIVNDPIFVCLQNGYGAEKTLEKYIPNSKICSGSILVASKRLSHNEVHDISLLRLQKFGAYNFSYEMLKNKLQNFDSGWINLELVDNYLDVIFEKLQYSVCHNGLSGIFNMNFKALYSDKTTTMLIQKLITEISNIIDKLGLKIHQYTFEELKKDFSNHAHYPSTYHDVINKQHTEIPSINGAISELGLKLDVDVTYNTLITKLIENIEKRY